MRKSRWICTQIASFPHALVALKVGSLGHQERTCTARHLKGYFPRILIFRVSILFGNEV